MDDLIPGEILEDIECLDPEDSYENENDALNFDTFGVSEPWTTTSHSYSDKKSYGRYDRMDMPDLSSLYLSENHSNLLNFISNIETAQVNLLDRKLDELDIDMPSQKFTSPKMKRDKLSHIKEFNAWTHKISNISSNSTNAITKNQKSSMNNSIPLNSFDHDIKLIRNMGFFPIPASKLETDELQFKVPDQWRPPITVNRRHINSKAIRSGQDCLFMSASEFDNILRIQLTQVSKNPKLQSYSGRWNFKLMVNSSSPQQPDASPDNNPELLENNNNSTTTNDENSNKIKCFGRTSVACIRHGRKLIYLENNDKLTNDVIPPHKRAKWAIEDCYEQLYIILELIDSIKSGIGSMEKLKAVRDQKLISLYESLTQTNIDQTESKEANNVFEEVLNLNKGKKMVLRISKTFKPTLKIKLVLEILKCKTLFPLLTQPTQDNYDSTQSDHTIDLFKFVCSSIDQITSKRISNFVTSFLELPNVNNLLPKIAESKYGVSFGVIVGNKIIQGLESDQLTGDSCRIFVDLISSKDETLSPIIEHIRELINNNNN